MIIADLSAGGAQRVFSQLANHWADAGYRLCVVTMSQPADDFFQLNPEIDRISIGGFGSSRGLLDQITANFGRIRRLRRAMRQARARCIVSFIGTMNILCVLAAVGLRLRLVICERNDPSRQRLGRPWDELRRWLYRHADLITANSHGAIEELKAFVPESKLAYVANPEPTVEASVQADLSSRCVLNVGRLNRQKAQDVLIRAFAKARATAAGDWRLVVVGEGEERENLQALACDLGIDDAVELVGRTDDPYVYYANAAIFALPSRYEGTPNVLLEAMTCGLPVIVSDASDGPLDYVRHEQTGLVVAVDDVDDLAHALSRLMQDVDVRGSLGGAAREFLKQRDRQAPFDAWTSALGLKRDGAAVESRHRTAN